MCGRYVSISNPEQLAEHFEVTDVRTESLGERYNVAPTLDVYAVIDREGQRRLGTLRWGFIPFWARELKKAPSPINARVETVHTKQMFRDAFERRRCILPADGFYEWQAPASDAGPRAKKTPYFIHDPDDKPLAFAGIWSVWRPEEDADPVFSCAIVTKAASGRMEELHERMPVMLPERLWDEWLGEEEVPSERLQDMITALGPPSLEAYAVTTRVNNVRNDGPELVEPASA